MEKQDFLNLELFQVDETTGKVYNIAEEENGVRHFLPDNEIWVRMANGNNLVLKSDPFYNDIRGFDSVKLDYPEFESWPSYFKDPKYFLFGALLDFNSELFISENVSNHYTTWKTHSKNINGINYYWTKIVFDGPVKYLPLLAFTGISTYVFIKEIAIPNKVEWIGPKAFSQLGQLNSVILGSGVKSMKASENASYSGNNPGGSWVFDDVLNLWHITCLAKEAPLTDRFCFSTIEITPSAEAGYNTIWEMSKHYINGNTIVKDQDQEEKGVRAPQEGNINTLTLVEGAIGYDAEHFGGSAAYLNYWVNLVGGVVNGEEKDNWGFTKEYCTPQEEDEEEPIVLPEDLGNSLLYSSNSVTTSELGTLSNAPILTNTNNVDLTYYSSDTDVATINNNGIVTVLSNGSTTISAVFSGNSLYNAKTISYTLTVNSQQSVKKWHFIIIPKSKRRRYIKIIRVYS